MPSAISRFIPRPRVQEVDRIAVATSPEETWRAVRSLDLLESRATRFLFSLRAVPARALSYLSGSPPSDPPRTLRLDDIIGKGADFQLLAEVPGTEFVAGAVGAFWQPRIAFRHVPSAEFAAFQEPGLAKVAWSLHVAPRLGGGSWIGVDLRVDVTDDDAWRRFVPYWRLIGRFSRLIRRSALRRFQRSLGRPATDESRTLAGDEILPEARVSTTHAITIEAPVDSVWPWLVQMGCRRAGWYSFDRLDNGGTTSSWGIEPELQHLTVGDVLPATPAGADGFAVLLLDSERALVLGSPSLAPRAASAPPLEASWGFAGTNYTATWAFVLEPIGDVATRLVVRVRATLDPSLWATMLRPTILGIHSIMEHAQLRNLKLRAEALGRTRQVACRAA